MPNSSELIIYEPHIQEYGSRIFEVYRVELPDLRGKAAYRYWWFEIDTPREEVEQDILKYYGRNDANWQLALPF
jgi:hypothetical protein